MKILIADDHAIVRDGLRLLLDGHADVEVVAEAGNGRDALDLIASTCPDVVLLDIRMPEMGGLEVLEALRQTETPPGVLVLSMHDDLVLVHRAIELGADGYVLKSVEKDELLRALRSVHAGQPYLQDELTRGLVTMLATGSLAESEETPLSARQHAVLVALADGKDNQEIGKDLRLSASSIKAELRSIYATLGVSSRSEAVAVAFRLGLLS